MRHLETIIPFLDRVDRPYFARARALVNDWTDRYPANSRDRLITRLRSESIEQQLAAFWELYIHEVMRAAGWNMMVDPSVPGTNSVPDFLAVRGETRSLRGGDVVQPVGGTGCRRESPRPCYGRARKARTVRLRSLGRLKESPGFPARCTRQCIPGGSNKKQA